MSRELDRETEGIGTGEGKGDWQQAESHALPCSVQSCSILLLHG